MGLFHVLFAVALSLGLVRTRGKAAFEQCGRVGVLIINMAIPFFLGGPTDLVVFAGRYRTLPRTRVRLFVLTIAGQGLSHKTAGRGLT